MTEERLNLVQKLAKIRKQVEVMTKSRSGYNYTYVPEDEILAKVSVYMDKYHLSLIPNITPQTTSVTPYHYTTTKITRDGKTIVTDNNEILVQADMTWTWVNDDCPEETVPVYWGLVGQQSDASQAFGAGLTYSSRYFLLKFFNVATVDDDPDAFRGKQRQAEAAEAEAVAAELISTLDKLIKAYIAENSDEDTKKKVKEFLSKRGAKGGDYLKVKDPTVAKRLLQEFNNEFIESRKD